MTTFVIDPTDLLSLASVVDAPATSISPLASGAGRTLTPEQRERFARNGVLDPSGRVAGEIESIVASLARASGVVRVALIGAGFEFAVYSSDGSPVSLLAINNEIRVDSPPQNEDVFEYLANMLGTSEVLGADYDLRLTPSSAVVFAALIDEHRRGLFRALGGENYEPNSHDAGSLEVALRQPAGSLALLSQVVRTQLRFASSPTLAEIEVALRTLENEGFVHAHGSGFRLVDECLELAGHMLNIHMVLSLLVGSLAPNGEPSWADFSCAAAGLHDLLLIATDGDRLRMQTVTGRAVLDLVRSFLHQTQADAPTADAAITR